MIQNAMSACEIRTRYRARNTHANSRTIATSRWSPTSAASPIPAITPPIVPTTRCAPRFRTSPRLAVPANTMNAAMTAQYQRDGEISSPPTIARLVATSTCTA